MEEKVAMQVLILLYVRVLEMERKDCDVVIGNKNF